MSTYVMSDIHGRRDLFCKILEIINFNNNDTLYILGDVIDRGEESISLYQELMNMNNVHLIKGNHEEMCYHGMIGDIDCFNMWIRNGGEITRKQLMELEKDKRYNILSHMNHLPLYEIVDVCGKEFILVHAGLLNKPYMSIYDMLKEQNNTLMWTRGSFFEEEFDYDGYIIFGHTMTCAIPWEIEKHIPNNINIDECIKNSSIWKNSNKIGIDCGAVYGGRLACLRLDDLKEFYSSN